MRLGLVILWQHVAIRGTGLGCSTQWEGADFFCVQVG